MPNRIAVTNLNGRTIDIINTIRQNANAEYQSLVPVVETAQDIPKVGEIIYGHPGLANQFIGSLMNRIAFVLTKSATFNNPYKDLKKGYLNFGETVEEVFVNLAKAREFSAEKAAAREFKRTLPDVRTAFHSINWKVQYPITIQHEDLRQAFTSAEGVADLVARIVQSCYTAAEYDEFLLFKYLIIKGVTHGKLFPVAFDASDMKNAAKTFRGTSNALTFINTKYNAEGVHTNTEKKDQYIFMDAQFNADYDVDVLAAAFNMDKAEFTGRLRLIDDFTEFDNERFAAIREASTGLEAVTDDELALMANVKAVLVDAEWFQIYDNLDTMSETYVAGGLYWNYFYNQWKTVSVSPFSNAVVFVDDAADITLGDELTLEVQDKTVAENCTILTLVLDDETEGIANQQVRFVQTEDATEDGIAVHKYGAIICPPLKTELVIEVEVGGVLYKSCTKSESTYTEATIDVADYAPGADAGSILLCKASLLA